MLTLEVLEIKVTLDVYSNPHLLPRCAPDTSLDHSAELRVYRMVNLMADEMAPMDPPVSSKHTPSTVIGGIEKGPHETLEEAGTKWEGGVPIGRNNWSIRNCMFAGLLKHSPPKSPVPTPPGQMSKLKTL